MVSITTISIVIDAYSSGAGSVTLATMDTTNLSAYTEIEQGALLSGFDLGFIMPLVVAVLVATGILSAIFMIYLVVSIMRRRKLHQATIDMQKDIRKIRELLEQGSTPAHLDAVRPTRQPYPHDTIARQDDIAASDQTNDPALNRLESRGPDYLA